MIPQRAWRFTHPDTVKEDEASGFVGSHITLIEGDEVVKQALLMLLSTRPGERIMRPDYGCPLHLLLFSPNDETTAGLAIHYVRQAIARYEPRIEIITLDATYNPQQPSELRIQLDYCVIASQHTDSLEIILDTQNT